LQFLTALILSQEKITASYSRKNFVLNKKAIFNFICLNHFLKISEESEIIFPSNHSFLKSKLHELKKPEAISDFKAFPIIMISLSPHHLYKNVSWRIIVFFIFI
jgi:hypothetical protein